MGSPGAYTSVEVKTGWCLRERLRQPSWSGMGSCGTCPGPAKDKGTQGERRQWLRLESLGAFQGPMEPGPGPGPGAPPLQVAICGREPEAPGLNPGGRGGRDLGKRLAGMWLKTCLPLPVSSMNPWPGDLGRVKSRRSNSEAIH